MTMRTPGRTGIRVGAYRPGTVVLGRAGDTDHDDGVRIVHRARDAGPRDVAHGPPAVERTELRRRTAPDRAAAWPR